jgi:predicted ATPase
MATEPPKDDRTPERKLVLEVLEFLRTHEVPLSVHDFRTQHEDALDIIDRLVEEESLRVAGDTYCPTVKGLLRYAVVEAEKEFEFFDRLLPSLKEAYRRSPGKPWTIKELAELAQLPEGEVERVLGLLLRGVPIWGGLSSAARGDLIQTVTFSPDVLKAQPFAVGELRDEMEEPSGVFRLMELRVDGYRALEGFEARLDPLTVIIGANASGKSSLFDLLGFVSFAVVNPLPPEVDPRSIGRALFHLGAPERIGFSFLVERGTGRPLRYTASVRGPIGSPSVVSEKLVSLRSEASRGLVEGFAFLDFKAGKGLVRSPKQLVQRPWSLPVNELALRRALDPNLITPNRFREYVASWGFYADFDVGIASAVRRPVPTEPEPSLDEDGSNLSAVLHYLLTEHRDRWDELETHLRSAIPTFHSLNMKSRGGPGLVMGFWREERVNGELTLADLSDGTLKFLCWAALCLSPRKPPLICIDEPELGLHPRVLPVLAGLLRQASAESQLLVATHSPYFLSQFSLEEIAVMKKVEGRAVFARPASNEALRREIEELGGDLAQLHISDELEVRS